MRIYIWGVPYGAPLFLKNMPKITLASLILVTLFTLNTSTICAQEVVVSASGTLRGAKAESPFDYRVVELRRFLEKFNSPLSIYAEDFVRYADIYGVDYRLVPAITGVESTFGKRIPHLSYNAYGWANGSYKFTSWRHSISHVTMKLKYEYMNKGATTIPKIARIYAPPSTTWGRNVTSFVRKISMLPVSYDI